MELVPGMCMLCWEVMLLRLRSHRVHGKLRSDIFVSGIICTEGESVIEAYLRRGYIVESK